MGTSKHFFAMVWVVSVENMCVFLEMFYFTRLINNLKTIFTLIRQTYNNLCKNLFIDSNQPNQCGVYGLISVSKVSHLSK